MNFFYIGDKKVILDRSENRELRKGEFIYEYKNRIFDLIHECGLPQYNTNFELIDLSKTNEYKLWYNEKQKRLRRDVYSTESDCLFLESQYDGTNEKKNTWKEKVKEIKERYPFI